MDKVVDMKESDEKIAQHNNSHSKTEYIIIGINS